MTGNNIAPLQPGKRIDAIDIVRGFALFGILVENMVIFKYPILFERYPSSIPSGIDNTAAWFIQLFFAGKFYMIFAFIFGLGFYFFMERILAQGGDFLSLYRRRLLTLLLIGLMHMILLWIGDILVSYALVGFLLIAFRHSSLEAIKKWIVSLALLSSLLYGLLGLYNGFAQIRVGDMFDLYMTANINRVLAYYANSSYVELLLYRVGSELPNALISLVISVPSILALFLCGFYIGKKKIFSNLSENRVLLRKALLWGLILGAFFMSLFVAVEAGYWQTGIPARSALLLVSNHAASFFLFPAYIALILLLLQGNLFNLLLKPFSAAGRMSLTNYLSQTIICIIIFNGFGFGLVNRLSVTEGLSLALAIFVLQVIWSNIWLRKFRYGPMEWLWRVLTYKQLQPFLIAGKAKPEKELIS